MTIEQLFEEYHDAIYGYVYRLTGDADLSADVAQETFIRWVEDEPEDSNPRAWLYTVATNLVRDQSRVQSRRLVLLQETPDAAPLGAPTPAPDRSVEADERNRMVRRALDALPERERTMLLMQQEGFSHREIADATGTTTKSVGTMLARALRRFADQIAPDLSKLK